MSETLRRIQVRWLGDYRTEISVRGVHILNGDETPQYGGQDSGPMPTELLLAGVASCMCLAVSHVARKRRITLGELAVSAEAEKDMKEFRFHSIALLVQADLPQAELEALVARAKDYCFVSNTLIHGCAVNTASQSTQASSKQQP
jgi:putative redox protein